MKRMRIITLQAILLYLTENHINLDKEDSDRLGIIVARSGGTVDAQNIVKYLKCFLENIAIMFLT
jgi:hypothetical protein